MEGFRSLAGAPQELLFFVLALLLYGVLFLIPVRERRTMWETTLMVVLMSLSAALYAAILIPFKILPIIPGVTEIRPANAIPIVCSLLFGPAGAWGSGVGNLIGDLFFGLGPGSLFGFVGNFLYGFIPYTFWRALVGSRDPDPKRKGDWALLLFICAVAGAACAFTIAWGIDVALTGVPFAVLGMIIFFNNFLMAALLAPPLLFALLPRVRAWGLHYTAVMPAAEIRRPRLAWLGVILVTLGAIGGLTMGFGIDTRLYGQKLWIPLSASAPQAAEPESAEAPAPARPGEEAATLPTQAKTGEAAPAAKDAARPQTLGERKIALGLGLLPALLLLSLGILLL